MSFEVHVQNIRRVLRILHDLGGRPLGVVCLSGGKCMLVRRDVQLFTLREICYAVGFPVTDER